MDTKGTQPYIYMYPFFPKLPPIHATIYHQAEFPVLYSRTLLVFHFNYSRMDMSIPNSLSLLPILPPHPGNHKFILLVCSVFLFNKQVPLYHEILFKSDVLFFLISKLFARGRLGPSVPSLVKATPI